MYSFVRVSVCTYTLVSLTPQSVTRRRGRSGRCRRRRRRSL